MQIDDCNKAEEKVRQHFIIGHHFNQQRQPYTGQNSGRDIKSIHYHFGNHIQNGIDGIGTKGDRDEYEQSRRNAYGQRHYRQMQEIRFFHVSLFYRFLNLLSGPASGNGIAEVPPHLQEYGQGKGKGNRSPHFSARLDRHGDT